MAVARSTQEPVRSSTYSLQFSRIFSYNPGFLAPVHTLLTIPGDSLGISINTSIDTLPVETPAYTRFRGQIRYFWTDLRAYIPELAQDLFQLDPTAVSLPVALPPCIPVSYTEEAGTKITTTDVIGNRVVAPSCLSNFLGYPVGMVVPLADAASFSSWEEVTSQLYKTLGDRFQSLLPWVTYLHTYYKYYMNPQEPIYRFLMTDPDEILPKPIIVDFDGKKLGSLLTNATQGRFYTDSLGNPSSSPRFHDVSKVNVSNTSGFATISDLPIQQVSVFRVPFGGLAILPYLPSVNECFISGESAAKIDAATTVDASASFTISDLLAKDKIRKYLSLGYFGASGYSDWVYAQFAVKPQKGFSSPQYLGGSEFLVSFSQVVAQSAEGLGELGGKGSGNGRTKYRRFAFDSYGVFQVMFDIRPILNYSQGMDEQFTFDKLSDLPSYEMAGIPWEPLRRRTLSSIQAPFTNPTNRLTFNSTYYGKSDSQFTRTGGYFDSTVVGYRPAWTAYRSAFNRSLGLLAPDQSLETWTQNRLYETGTDSRFYGDVSMFSTYIDPSFMNSVFVDAAPTASNFIVYMDFDIDFRRPLSNNAVPTF